MTENKEELQQQIAERVFLVKNSLLSANYQSIWPRIELKQLLNRLFILIQRQCAITVMQESSDGNFEVIYHTLQDPLWKGTFETYLREKIPGKIINNRIIVNGSDNKNYIFKIVENIYLMIHEVKFVESNTTTFIDFPVISLKDDETLQKLVQGIEKNLLNNQLSQFYGSKNIKNNIYDKINRWHNGEMIVDRVHELGFDKNLNKEVISKSYFDDHQNKIRHVFEKEYRRICLSPLISAHQKNPPNIFFFVKVFSQETCRYHDEKIDNEGAYAHGVRAVIPDSQRKHLERAFKTLSKANKNRGDQSTISFPIEIITQNNKGDYVYRKTKRKGEKQKIEEKPCFDGDDDFFWEKLDKHKGIEEILNEMESGFGPHARSISDSVLETGYVHIKYKPFTNGGAERLEDEEWEKGAESLDYRRLVYFHYALHMMAPEGADLSALIIPQHIGGSPWFCAGFLSKVTQNDSKHETWLRNFHFYHSVCNYIVRSVRRSLSNLYLEEIQNIYRYGQEAIIDNIARDIDFTKQNVCDVLNPQFKALTRVYPFKRVELKVAPDRNTEKNKEQADFVLNYLKTVPFTVFMRENEFFLPHLEGYFLEQGRIKEILINADRLLKQEVQQRTPFVKNI